MEFGQIFFVSVLILGLLIAVSIFILCQFWANSTGWTLAISFFLFGTGYHFFMWETYILPQGKLALLIPIGLAFPVSFLSYMFKPGGIKAQLIAMTILGSIQYYNIGELFGSKRSNKNLMDQSQYSQTNTVHEVERIRLFSTLNKFFVRIMDYKKWDRGKLKNSVKNLLKK